MAEFTRRPLPTPSRPPAPVADHDAPGPDGFTTPVVIAHRGASGYRPEHTLAAYELAVDLGADFIEPDLVMTRDGVLVARHEPDISETTNVADRPEFADRQMTKQIDGAVVSGWFVDDFTLAELKNLRAREPRGQTRRESAGYDGCFEVPTFEECLQLRADLARSSGRSIGIIPEIKHSTYLHEQGFDPEAEMTRLAEEYLLNHPEAPLWVQSLEVTSLKKLRRHGFQARTTFITEVKGGPWDLGEASTSFAELTTARSLRTLSRWIDGIAPDKAQVIPLRADGALGEPTTLVADAHAAGLTVTPWTFRAENEFLPASHRRGSDPATFGDAVDEVLAFFHAGVDGIFCDHPDVGIDARARFLARN